MNRSPREITNSLQKGGLWRRWESNPRNIPPVGRMLLAVLVAVLAVAPAAWAAPSRDRWEPGPYPARQLADRLHVTIERADCPGLDPRYVAGCADPGASYAVYVRSDLVGTEWREAVLHELGHQVDFHWLTPQDRDTFRALMGYTAPWFPATDGVDPRPPGERWADAVAYCLLTRRDRADLLYEYIDGRLAGTTYRWRPTRRQAHTACDLVKAVIAR